MEADLLEISVSVSLIVPIFDPLTEFLTEKLLEVLEGEEEVGAIAEVTTEEVVLVEGFVVLVGK